MKPFGNGQVFKTPLILKISAFFVLLLTSLYLGKHWSDGYQQLIFFTTTRQIRLDLPNLDKLFNVSALIDENRTQTVSDKTPSLASAPLPVPPPPPPLQRFGIMNENGTTSDEFEVGELDEGLVEDWRNETEGVDGDGDWFGVSFSCVRGV